MTQTRLPIYDIENELVNELTSTNRLIVTAPTGSGKTTQVPQMILDHGLAGNDNIVILQPRRLSARLLAKRVAQERSVQLGSVVGYQIRFEDVTSDQTRIKYETEGILLRQLISNPTLEGISTVIFDEFHERHLYSDVSLARILDLQESQRPNLKIIVMSATLAVPGLERYLHPCQILESKGRTFPVSVNYLPKPVDPATTPVWDLATRAFEQAVSEGREGDVLIFMPGAYEIQRTLKALQLSPATSNCIMLPLHGELSPNDQDAAVSSYEKRKIIVSTNVAETSLTIDGVRIVIDGGLVRIPRYDPVRGINTLYIEKISRASAEQRTGRAGRTADGYCYRLWTETEHRQRADHELPEIQRVELSETILTLKVGGIDNIQTFRWLDPPEEKSVQRSLTLLIDLGALDANGNITELGRTMLSFPIHPRYSRMLLEAEKYKCVRTIALISALTQGRDILLKARSRDVKESREQLLGTDEKSDFFQLMRAWRYAFNNNFNLNKCRRLGIHAQSARQIKPLFDYFIRIAQKQGLTLEDSPPDDDAVQKCLLSGFSDQLAKRPSSGTLRYHMVHHRRGELSRDSVVRNCSLVVPAEIHDIQHSNRDTTVLLTHATAIDEAWLQELYPEDCHSKDVVQYDPTTKSVAASQCTMFRDLVLDNRLLPKPPEDQAATLLAEQVLEGTLTLKKWDKTVETWISRVNLLAKYCPELEIPGIGDEERKTLMEQVCAGSYRYKDIKDKPVWPSIQSWLPNHLTPLIDQYAPERLTLSNGRKPKVKYETGKEPYIIMRIQELFDVKEIPAIAMNQVKPLIHITGPNQRPVQITSDLPGFWENHYPRIKKEMQRKYPKHEWR